MEGDAEEQGEGEDAAEKVLDQSAQAHIRTTCERVIYHLRRCFFFFFFFRTVRMRRWGTCSWPGRCWK